MDCRATKTSSTNPGNRVQNDSAEAPARPILFPKRLCDLRPRSSVVVASSCENSHMTNLKPWYHVVEPRQDLKDNRPLDASEFAVHLDHIRTKRGTVSK